ncbi:MAG TPA: GNAT family N-acetyltransferase [Allosphingosinicella sp.]|nr:GNAT family N-acetyltransferase [Allosphingosinicella sp.]
MDEYRIEEAGEAEIAAMRAIEASPGYEKLVGRWSAERHRAEMAKGSARYFVLRDADGAVAGFALVQGFGDEDRKLHLKRIAVAGPGRGAGSLLLRAVVGRVFEETDANRLDLDVFLDNDRARRAYEKAGFREEGVLRDWHRHPDGRFSDVRLMSVLRREWAAGL